MTNDSGAVRFLMIGGLASSLINFRGPLLKELVAKGLEVHAAAPAIECDDEVSASLDSMGVFAHSIPLARTGLNPIRDLWLLAKLVVLMRRVRPDVLLAYTIKPVIWGLIAAWIAGIPRRYAMITGLGYAFTGEVTGKRKLIQFVAKGLYRFSLKRANAVFFQNPDDRSLFKRLKLIPASVPMVLINGSGVDLTYYHPRPLPEGPLSFLLIARLLGDKGIREYAAAATIVRQEFPDTEFHLVGGVDTNPDCISQSELDHWQAEAALRWHGPQKDVRPYIEASHVYVLPSYREGMPRTVLEAMAIGRAIITTDAPGCRETVINGENGFLVPPRSADILAQAMMYFVENQSLVVNMAVRSRELVEERYAADKVAASMLEAMHIHSGGVHEASV